MNFSLFWNVSLLAALVNHLWQSTAVVAIAWATCVRIKEESCASAVLGVVRCVGQVPAAVYAANCGRRMDAIAGYGSSVRQAGGRGRHCKVRAAVFANGKIRCRAPRRSTVHALELASRCPPGDLVSRCAAGARPGSPAPGGERIRPGARPLRSRWRRTSRSFARRRRWSRAFSASSVRCCCCRKEFWSGYRPGSCVRSSPTRCAMCGGATI